MGVKMNKKIVLILMLTFVVFVIVGCSSTNEKINDQSNQDVKTTTVDSTGATTSIAEDVTDKGWDTEFSSGEVAVDLTPKKYAEGKLFVQIGISTHTVNDLDSYNLKEIIELRYKDRIYNPLEAPSLSGHHNNGELIFEIEEEPAQFTILINGLHDLAVREFSW